MAASPVSEKTLTPEVPYLNYVLSQILSDVMAAMFVNDGLLFVFQGS